MRTFGLLRQKYAAVLAAIDHLKIGLAIALPSGEILLENSEARRQFEEGGAFRLGPDRRLTCTSEDASREIAAGIAAMSATAAGENARPEIVMHINRRSGRDPVVLDISPIAETEGVFDRSLRGAVLKHPAKNLNRWDSLEA